MFLLQIMKLTQLELINFRNYKKLKLKLSKNINIFIGNNGQGKTNILESIYILGITKSHRYGEQISLIKRNMEVAKIKGVLVKDKIINDLEIDIYKNSKKTYINKTEIKKISKYIANLNVIMFNPDDLEIIKGSPQVRRNFLNIQISQLDLDYINNLNEYNKILKIRNEYLKTLSINNYADKRYLDIITDKLIDKSLYIYRKRIEYINLINKNIDDIYFYITNNRGLHILYESSINLDNLNDDDFKLKLKNKFDNNYKREIMQGNTLYGPHRDDFSFYLSEDNLRIFSSQGGQRLAVICFKLSEIDIFKSKTGYYPILLLDDIFSEIDNKKKNKLIKYIDNNIQTVITATDLKNINKKIIDNAKIFEVNSGYVKEREAK